MKLNGIFAALAAIAVVGVQPVMACGDGVDCSKCEKKAKKAARIHSDSVKLAKKISAAAPATKPAASK